jgi:hypothetical protein
VLEPIGSVKTISGNHPFDGNYRIHFGVVSPSQSYLHDQNTTGNLSLSRGRFKTGVSPVNLAIQSHLWYTNSTSVCTKF